MSTFGAEFVAQIGFTKLTVAFLAAAKRWQRGLEYQPCPAFWTKGSFVVARLKDALIFCGQFSLFRASDTRKEVSGNPSN